MDFLEFFAIVEQDREILNPISLDTLERVARYANVRDGSAVLDVGSGKAAMLRSWAARWQIHATGLELNPVFVNEAREQIQVQDLADRVRIWEGSALDFTPDAAGYDVIACLGATFALGGFAEAVTWMRDHLKPGGRFMIGDVYLRLSATAHHTRQDPAQDLPTLRDRHAALQAAGVDLVGLVDASTEEWDHYTSLMWGAVSRWAITTDHPARDEVLKTVQEGRERYLNWERDHMGWAVMVGQVKQP